MHVVEKIFTRTSNTRVLFMSRLNANAHFLLEYLVFFWSDNSYQWPDFYCDILQICCGKLDLQSTRFLHPLFLRPNFAINTNSLQGFKKRLKWISYRFEFYWFLCDKIQNEVFLEHFYWVGFRATWDITCMVYVIKSLFCLKGWQFHNIKQICIISWCPETKSLWGRTAIKQFLEGLIS